MLVLVLQQMIGLNGKELWKKANGIDENSVVPYSERKYLKYSLRVDVSSTEIKHTMYGSSHSSSIEKNENNKNDFQKINNVLYDKRVFKKVNKMYRNFFVCLIFSVFCSSCVAQKKEKNTASNIEKRDFLELMGYGRDYKKNDSLNHIDAHEFNIKVLPKDTLINGKRYYPLILDSKYNLRTDTKYYLSYNSKGILLFTWYENKGSEIKFLNFDNTDSDIIGTLFGRMDLFQLIRKKEKDYEFNYIQDPRNIEIYHMYGDKVEVKKRDDKKITLILYYHDKFSTFQKEFTVFYDNTQFY